MESETKASGDEEKQQQEKPCLAVPMDTLDPPPPSSGGNSSNSKTLKRCLSVPIIRTPSGANRVQNLRWPPGQRQRLLWRPGSMSRRRRRAKISPLWISKCRILLPSIASARTYTYARSPTRGRCPRPQYLIYSLPVPGDIRPATVPWPQRPTEPLSALRPGSPSCGKRSART